jgi:hypothetical protein
MEGLSPQTIFNSPQFPNNLWGYSQSPCGKSVLDLASPLKLIVIFSIAFCTYCRFWRITSNLQ